MGSQVGGAPCGSTRYDHVTNEAAPTTARARPASQSGEPRYIGTTPSSVRARPRDVTTAKPAMIFVSSGPGCGSRRSSHASTTTSAGPSSGTRPTSDPMTMGSWPRMPKSGFRASTRWPAPSDTAIGIVTANRIAHDRGSQGRMVTHRDPATAPKNSPSPTTMPRLPPRVMSPILLPFSVNDPWADGTSRAARRMTSRPPTPATMTPTINPARPPRVMSRSTSIFGSPGGAVIMSPDDIASAVEASICCPGPWAGSARR